MATKPGDIVRIRFLDHAEDGEAIEFEVFGKVLKVTRVQICVACWDYAGRPPEAIEDHNVKWFSILRSTILEIQKLNDG